MARHKSDDSDGISLEVLRQSRFQLIQAKVRSTIAWVDDELV